MVEIKGMVGKSYQNKDRHGWNSRHGGKKVSLIRTHMVGIVHMVGKSVFNKDTHGWNNRHGGKKF